MIHLAARATALLAAVAASGCGGGRLYARAGFAEAGRRPGYYPREGGTRASALVLRRDLV